MEKTGSQGQAPEAISTRELAEKTLEIYWPQAAPFVLSKGASILKQSGKGRGGDRVSDPEVQRASCP
jgi:hypothetical protein